MLIFKKFYFIDKSKKMCRMLVKFLQLFSQLSYEGLCEEDLSKVLLKPFGFALECVVLLHSLDYTFDSKIRLIFYNYFIFEWKKVCRMLFTYIGQGRYIFIKIFLFFQCQEYEYVNFLICLVVVKQ
eukprot:TRINITY_DN2196_c0_g1_i3.p3 TRINITY_DN2196_c0_g1~~TRINITY_DN2196_c0_g1_i3.p3  ORF type:complete len:126 (-),score=2.07 TRINITY_DN2196_c0_g1_i3:85-462(-)